MTLGAIVTYLEKIIPQSMFTGWFEEKKKPELSRRKKEGIYYRYK